MGFLETWYDLIDERDIVAATPGRMMKNLVAALAKARGRDRHKSFNQLTETVEGQHRIVETLPLVVRETHAPDGRPIFEALKGILRSYVQLLLQDRTRLLSRYRVVDVARKVVGVGSVAGTSCRWSREADGDDPFRCGGKSRRPCAGAMRRPRSRSATRASAWCSPADPGSPDAFPGWGPGKAAHVGRDFRCPAIGRHKAAGSSPRVIARRRRARSPAAALRMRLGAPTRRPRPGHRRLLRTKRCSARCLRNVRAGLCGADGTGILKTWSERICCRDVFFVGQIQETPV